MPVSFSQHPPPPHLFSCVSRVALRIRSGYRKGKSGLFISGARHPPAVYNKNMTAILKYTVSVVAVLALSILATTTINAQVPPNTLPSCALPVDTTNPDILPPLPRILVFEGSVNVGDQPAPDGTKIYAVINLACVAGETEAGRIGSDATPGLFNVSLDAPEQQGYEGQAVTFHLEDGTPAAESEIYIGYNSYSYDTGDRSNPSPSWSFQVRRVDINFPEPPPPPPPDPAGVDFIEGLARSPLNPSGLIGWEIFARIGDYDSDPVAIQPNGRFLLVVNPGDESYVGQTIRFLLRGTEIQAFQTLTFIGDTSAAPRSLDIIFPDPAPPEPEPVPDPEPPVVQPPPIIPVPDPPVEPTMTVVPEPEGDGCQIGGGFSLSFLLLLTIPGSLALVRTARAVSRRRP